MHEPLTIAFIFPFLDHDPWQIKSTPKMLSLGRTMPGLLSNPTMAAGPILHEFFHRFRDLRTMQSDVVRRMLYFESKC
jgi:hypothetical protein